MAKITIELDTNESREDILVLKAVAAAYAPISADAEATIMQAIADESRPTLQSQADQQIVYNAGMQTAQRRTRRTKEQIAADNAAQAAAGPSHTLGSATSAPSVMQAPSGSTLNGSSMQSGGGVTLEQINEHLMGLMAERGDGVAQRAIDEIKRITNGAHTGTRNLPPGYWPAVMAALEAL
jgi:hypothetical protein